MLNTHLLCKKKKKQRKIIVKSKKEKQYKKQRKDNELEFAVDDNMLLSLLFSFLFLLSIQSQ